MAVKETHNIVQGDSFGHNFTSPDVPVFDGNWVGRWAIVPALGKPALLDGALGRSVDASTLLLRIKPVQTETLPVGTYTLVVQVENPVEEFRKEVMQVTFKVSKQGIPS